MPNSESTMYLIPCATCGHASNKHGGYDPTELFCLVHVCPCDRYTTPKPKRLRVNGKFVKGVHHDR